MPKKAHGSKYKSTAAAVRKNTKIKKKLLNAGDWVLGKIKTRENKLLSELKRGH